MCIAEKSPTCLNAPYRLADTSGECLCVAVLAARGYLRAAPPRIKRMMRPLDRGVFCHLPGRVYASGYAVQSSPGELSIRLGAAAIEWLTEGHTCAPGTADSSSAVKDLRVRA